MLQALFEDILTGLTGYYDGPLTTGFWNGSFYQEIQNQFSDFNGDNQAAATNLQQELSAKHDFMW